MVAATASAATNGGNNGSGAMAVASKRDFLSDWEAATGKRRRPQWDVSSRDAATVYSDGNENGNGNNHHR